MYRKDIDRHLDNMDDLRRKEITLEDKKRMNGKNRTVIRLISLILILLAAFLLIRKILL